MARVINLNLNTSAYRSKCYLYFTDDDIILSEVVPVSESELDNEIGMRDEYPEPVHPHQSDNMASRIVGGNKTTIQEYPHQVSFIVNGSYFCGGFIISKDYILTAAHCAQK
jgi:hypothetical protein